MSARRSRWLAACLLLALFPTRAHAVLDVENKGPTLAAGAFAMRITNIGSIGNPFFAQGRSFDPSFEYPRGSGIEGLNHADLWVGARNSEGAYRVSGGPLLEWRPTLDADDHVRTGYGGQFGAQPFVDDDGDGKIDEEVLNGKDDDGDGEVDEDLGVVGAQELYAEYVDDRPEAIAYGYSGGESHVPLHLSVKQQAFTWTAPGYDRIAGIHFSITNHGNETLEDVRIGLFADLESRAAGEASSVNDQIKFVHYEIPYNDGVAFVPSIDTREYGTPPDQYAPYIKSCTGILSGDCPVVYDGLPSSGLPAFGVIPLSHTVDPLAVMEHDTPPMVDNRVDPYVTAPANIHFDYHVYAMDLPPGQGGPPIIDADRYTAMQGAYPGPPSLSALHDYAVLVSCGPFVRMPPGRTYDFDVALVCGANPDTVAATMALAAILHHGTWINEYADTSLSQVGNFLVGRSGFTGHETCFTPPAGLELRIDPHCYGKYPVKLLDSPPDYSYYLPHNVCTWTDVDCDACTGFNGNETQAHWPDPTAVPPSPAYRAVPGDRRVTIEWDNSPEVLLGAAHSTATPSPVRFTGYNVYRLSDWRRHGLLPGPGQFQLIASFGLDTLQGQVPLGSITDSTLQYDRITFDRKQYPIGRYRFTDLLASDGFDYLYVVTTVGERSVPVTPTFNLAERFESPIVSSLDSMVTPHAPPGARAGGVWVVPNPYRGGVVWDRPPVAGDPFGRHLDFLGLPPARCTIKIWTVAGDLVDQLDHDGSQGDGEARWNLISRNGQDVESGVYLFTVDSRLGHQVGKFVVMR